MQRSVITAPPPSTPPQAPACHAGRPSPFFNDDDPVDPDDPDDDDDDDDDEDEHGCLEE